MKRTQRAVDQADEHAPRDIAGDISSMLSVSVVAVIVLIARAFSSIELSIILAR